MLSVNPACKARATTPVLRDNSKQTDTIMMRIQQTHHIDEKDWNRQRFILARRNGVHFLIYVIHAVDVRGGQCYHYSLTQTVAADLPADELSAIAAAMTIIGDRSSSWRGSDMTVDLHVPQQDKIYTLQHMPVTAHL